MLRRTSCGSGFLNYINTVTRGYGFGKFVHVWYCVAETLKFEAVFFAWPLSKASEITLGF